MTEILGYIATAFSPGNLIFALVGTILGIIVGALPGFTPTMGIAVLIPVTYTIDSTTALVFLGAIYCGSMFGGSISAILINTPGTSAAAATAMDGYAMTLKAKRASGGAKNSRATTLRIPPQKEDIADSTRAS